MISLSEIVKRVRVTCPSFARRVGGTAEFSEASKDETSDLPLPHAFVIPMFGEDMGQLSPNPEVASEKVKEFYAVVVCIDNRVNRAGAVGLSKLDPLEQLVAIQKELRKAFIGWRMVPQYDPVRYSRDAHLGMDNKRMWHQWEWSMQAIEQPDATDASYAEVSDFVNELSSDSMPLSGPSNGLRTIHVNGSETGATGGSSYDDLWPQTDPPTEPSEEALVAARLRADFSLPVSLLDPAPPSPEEIGGAITKAPDYVSPDEAGRLIVDSKEGATV